MSERAPRRTLFWQVYPTLVASLLLFAFLAAGVGHLMMSRMHGTLTPPAGARVHFVLLFVLLAIVVAIGAWPVMARATRRLEALRRGVAGWGAGDMTWRADAGGDDEIAALAASFNTAADRIQALLAAHKSLLANASHELRSPLARLIMATEMLPTDAASIDLAALVRREVGEIDALVDEILLASRLENAADPGPRESIDLLALAAEEAARAAVDLAPPAGGESVTVEGWPRLLRRMIRNLIDNARMHGAPPVTVGVSLAEAEGGAGVAVWVEDHGPGVPANAGDRVFEPFYRPAGASEAVGGWGLGLALVRQIARLHGGEARVSAVDGATRFTVELPLRNSRR